MLGRWLNYLYQDRYIVQRRIVGPHHSHSRTKFQSDKLSYIFLCWPRFQWQICSSSNHIGRIQPQPREGWPGKQGNRSEEPRTSCQLVLSGVGAWKLKLVSIKLCISTARLPYNCAHIRSTKESLTFEYLENIWFAWIRGTEKNMRSEWWNEVASVISIRKIYDL